MSQCFTSPNYWGYQFQQIFEVDVKQIPIEGAGRVPRFHSEDAKTREAPRSVAASQRREGPQQRRRSVAALQRRGTAKTRAAPSCSGVTVITGSLRQHGYIATQTTTERCRDDLLTAAEVPRRCFTFIIDSCSTSSSSSHSGCVEGGGILKLEVVLPPPLHTLG